VGGTLLVIVARKETSLHQYLTMRFAGVRGVQVILDRRHGERRREQRPLDVERRSHRERRHRRGEVHHFGFTLVRLEPEPDPPR
jgi:hypothetical protein